MIPFYFICLFVLFISNIYCLFLWLRVKSWHKWMWMFVSYVIFWDEYCWKLLHICDVSNSYEMTFDWYFRYEVSDELNCSDYNLPSLSCMIYLELTIVSYIKGYFALFYYVISEFIVNISCEEVSSAYISYHASLGDHNIFKNMIRSFYTTCMSWYCSDIAYPYMHPSIYSKCTIHVHLENEHLRVSC